MGKRHDSIGIKQLIRYEWMEKTANLLLAGLDEDGVREELHYYLTDRKSTGAEGPRSEGTRTFVVSNLMRTWVTPDVELVPFRNAALAHLQVHPAPAKAIHWAMISAAYPFWFNTALQTGRLLNLQSQVTHAQIIKRLKEQYGDRQTVSRNGQFVVRSFIAWGVLQDAEETGCYEKATPLPITEQIASTLLLESVLHANPSGKAALEILVNSPALFPFQLPIMTGAYIAQQNERLDVGRYGLDDELLGLRV